MRDKIFKIWHLLQKQESMMRTATTLASPGFNQSYNPNRGREAPYEKYVLAAVDMQDDIDEILLSLVNDYEEDNRRILTETKGQRQRALRLKFICAKSHEEIARILGIKPKVVEERMKGLTAEKVPEGEFARFVTETRLLPVDAEIEDHLAYTYERLQDMVGAMYDEVGLLIIRHRTRARAYREKYKERMEFIQSVVDGLEEPRRKIVEMWLDGQKRKAIASATGMSLRFVQKTLSEL